MYLYEHKKYDDLLEFFENDQYFTNAEQLQYLAFVLVELGHFHNANRLLLVILNDEDINDKSKIYCYLGLSLYSQGKYCDARKNFLRSLCARGFYSNEAFCWLKILHMLSGFEPRFVERTDSLNIHFIDDFYEDERKWFIEKYRFSYERIQDFFTTFLPKPIDVFVYKGHKDSNDNNLSYANAPLSTIHVFWKEDCGHELTHVISHYINGGVKNKHAFVQEGIAECFNLDTYFCLKEDIPTSASIDDLWEHFDQYNKRFAHKVAKRFFFLLLQYGGRDKLLRLINDQSIENARRIYGALFIEIKNCVEREIGLKLF